jgi:mono/diheme cytochrome c family protein
MRVQCIFIIAALTALTGGCAQGPMGLSWTGSETNNSAAVAMLQNTDENSALALIQANCTSCHGSSSGPGGVYGLTDLNHLVSTSLVVPGSPSQSILFNAIVSGGMPPTGALSASEQTTINDWISGQ